MARQAQPYRKGGPRPQGRTLGAILRGEPAHRPHPLNSKRKLRRNRKAIQAGVRRNLQDRG